MQSISWSRWTEHRQYAISADGGMFFARYQPLNRRTGRPWQAGREIYWGHNVWRGGNYKTGVVGPLEKGAPPEFEVWSQVWTSIRTGFETLADAEAAIREEVKRSGK